MTKLGKRVWLLVIAPCLAAAPAWAGPPYVTDDPVPADKGEAEIYAFALGTHGRAGTEAEGGVEFNYGAAKDLQLTVALPLGFEDAPGARPEAGAGDMELAAKYRFVHQRDDGTGVDVSFYPSMTVPTGSHQFTNNKVTAFFPLWAQKEMGRWTLFGGGGFHLNPGSGNKNFWEEGIALTRQVSPRANLGIELYHEGKGEIGGHSETGMQIGGEYELSHHWALVAAGGPLLTHRAENGQYRFYFGLRLTS